MICCSCLLLTHMHTPAPQVRGVAGGPYSEAAFSVLVFMINGVFACGAPVMDKLTGGALRSAPSSKTPLTTPSTPTPTPSSQESKV